MAKRPCRRPFAREHDVSILQVKQLFDISRLYKLSQPSSANRALRMYTIIKISRSFSCLSSEGLVLINVMRFNHHSPKDQ